MNQFKKSEDLDIYEMDYFDNKNLQEICEVRQPVLFNFYAVNDSIIEAFSFNNVSSLGYFDVKIKDMNDYFKKEETITPVTMSLESSIKLMNNNKTSHFISESNEEFLEESGLLKDARAIDDYMKPTFNIYSHYDLIVGSKNSSTPLRYHNYYRQFLFVTSGKITVRMSPWKSSKYLHPNKDYDLYEFYSSVHPQFPQKEYKKDYEKVKFLTFEIQKGYVLFIPPYWWYNIEFSDSNENVLLKVTYSSFMNAISNIPDLTLYMLQQQNIQNKVSKLKMDEPIKEADAKIEEPPAPLQEGGSSIVESEISIAQDVLL